MKKNLLLIAAFAVFGCLSAMAQDADKVIAKFEQATGINNIDMKSADASMQMDMVVEAQGAKIPMNIIMQGKDKFRIEMEAMGQKMLMVRNGDKGWMSMAGNVQPLPKEALEQQAQQSDVLGSMKIDREKYEITYVGAEGDFEILKITPKDPNDKVGAQTVYFDKTTGLMTRALAKAQGVDMEILMSDYKEMSGVKIPTVLTTSMGGKLAAKVIVNDLKLDYPTAPWMFAELK